MSAERQGSHLVIDENNKAALVIIATVIGLSWTTLTLIIRIVSKLHVKKTIGLEEFLVIAASVAAGVSSACVLISIRHGLGRRASNFNDERDKVGLKLVWLSEIFYMITLGIAKGAALPLLSQLTRVRKFIVECRILAVFIILWCFLSILMVASRCHLGTPWSDISNRVCPSLYGRWVAVEAVSMLIEVMIFAIFISIINILNMRRTVKIKVALAFATRLPIIVPTVFRLFYLRIGLETSDDTVFALTNAIIATQIVLHYTTMAASFAYLKPFLRAFDSNLGGTVKFDATVSASYVHNGWSGRAGSNGEERGNSHTESYPMQRLEHALRPRSDNFERQNSQRFGQTLEGQRFDHSAPQNSSADSECNPKSRNQCRKYNSRESMAPKITKTREWQVVTEVRRQDP